MHRETKIIRVPLLTALQRQKIHTHAMKAAGVYQEQRSASDTGKTSDDHTKRK